jgi:hypothetical protein
MMLSHYREWIPQIQLSLFEFLDCLLIHSSRVTFQVSFIKSWGGSESSAKVLNPLKILFLSLQVPIRRGVVGPHLMVEEVGRQIYHGRVRENYCSLR